MIENGEYIAEFEHGILFLYGENAAYSFRDDGRGLAIFEEFEDYSKAFIGKLRQQYEGKFTALINGTQLYEIIFNTATSVTIQFKTSYSLNKNIQWQERLTT